MKENLTKLVFILDGGVSMGGPESDTNVALMLCWKNKSMNPVR